MKKFWSILAVSLVICMIVPMVFTATAGVALDPDHACSLTIAIDFDDLEDVDIDVDLYRLASVNAYCQYTALEGFECLNLVANTEDTDHWAKQMQKAFEVIAAEDSTIAPVATTTIHEMSTYISDLETGIYMALAHKPGASKDEYIIRGEDGQLYTFLQTPLFDYTVIPNMIALPGSDDGKTSGDEWFYDLRFKLKMDQTRRLGDLILTKQLLSNTELKSSVTFIFDIVATLGDDVVYNNVVGLSFDSVGAQSLVIEDLPAGAEVTVIERNTNVGFEIVSSPYVFTTVVARDEGEQAQAGFVNMYYETPVISHGVVNNFVHGANGWEWTAIEEGDVAVTGDQ